MSQHWQISKQSHSFSFSQSLACCQLLGMILVDQNCPFWPFPFPFQNWPFWPFTVLTVCRFAVYRFDRFTILVSLFCIEPFDFHWPFCRFGCFRTAVLPFRFAVSPFRVSLVNASTGHFSSMASKRFQRVAGRRRTRSTEALSRSSKR